MLDIESNLRSDATGEYKKELLQKFRDLGATIRQQINQGVAPDEYARLNRLLQAVDASVRVVEQY